MPLQSFTKTKTHTSLADLYLLGGVIFQCVLTCIWWDYIINFTSACHRNNNIIKCMVIIAASSLLICGQIGWSPFGWRIIAKPLTCSGIDSLHLQDFLPHCEWAPPSGPPLGIMLTEFGFCLFSLPKSRLDCLICDGLTFNTFIEKWMN